MASHTYVCIVLKHMPFMNTCTNVCTYTALSLSHLNRSPHTLITSTYKNHSFTPLSSLHFHPSHSTHHLTPHPSHPIPHFSLPHLTPHTSPLTPHPSHHPSHFTRHIPSLTSLYLTSSLTPSSPSHLDVTGDSVPDGLIVLRHHGEPLGVHLHQI